MQLIIAIFNSYSTTLFLNERCYLVVTLEKLIFFTPKKLFVLVCQCLRLLFYGAVSSFGKPLHLSI